MSLAESEDRNPYLTVGSFCALRYDGRKSDKEIAEQLRFDSADDMRIQLNNWDLPAWLVGEALGSESDKTERRGMTATEEPTELPPAYDALPLFRRALEKLNWAIGDLENRKEYLQNGRFVAHESTGPAYSPETGIEEGTLTIPLGGLQTPLEPLPALIGAYFLAGEPPEPLLEKLNRRPQSVDKDQIQALIEGRTTTKGHIRGLKSVAGMIARGIRGGAIRSGPTTGEVAEKIQNGVWYSRQLAQRGLNPATISERLREAGFTREEISQIRKLKKLPQPE